MDHSTGNILTYGVTLLDALFLTEIIGAQATAALVVTQCHAPSALAANNQTLEQSRTFPGWPALPLKGTGLLVKLQPLLILLKFFPADIADMGVFDQDRPLFTGQTHAVHRPWGSFQVRPFSKQN